MGKKTKSDVDHHTLDLQSLSRQVTERSPLPMAAMEGSTHIVRYVNPAFCRLVSRESEELIGVPFARAVPEGGEALPHLDQAYHTGEAETGVVKVHSAPHPLHWSYAIWAVPDASNHPVGVMIQVTDTTKAELFRQNVTAMNEELMLASVRQHELTEEAKNLNAELQQAYDRLVEESRERERLNEQLRQAHKMEAIGVLAGGIAHDFNNVLAAIIGFTELSIDDAPEGSLLKRHMNYVLTAGVRGRDLVKQILTFSHKSDLLRAPLHLTPIVSETFKLLRSFLPTTITMQLETHATSDIILAESTEITQLLMNLGTNAAYAMRESGGHLEIALRDVEFHPDNLPTHPDLAPGAYVELSVKDTGHGMDAETKNRIFEPFFTTKERSRGTGLGLAVVYGIAQSLGGAIIVSSEPGRGSVFTVFLPKVAHEENAQPEMAGEIAGGKECILFVDDEQVLVEAAKEMLGRLGYEVVATSDSSQALGVFSAWPDRFHCVVTDYTMPKATGVSLAKEIMKIRPNMPIILCTGYTEMISREEARALGIREFVMKPLVKREMAETIRRALDTKARD